MRSRPVHPRRPPHDAPCSRGDEVATVCVSWSWRVADSVNDPVLLVAHQHAAVSGDDQSKWTGEPCPSSISLIKQKARDKRFDYYGLSILQTNPDDLVPAWRFAIP